MATYKGIKGVKVVTKATDPTASEATGTVWYNSTGDALKYATQGTGAWASGTAVPTASHSSGGAGTVTAYLIWGGSIAPGVTTNSWSYDGTSWAATPALANAQSGTAGCGIQTAAMGCGGYNGGYNNRTEEYNGTAWANVNADSNKPAVGYIGLTGIQTAALSVAGYGSPPGQSNKCSEYDGTSWAAANVYPAAMSGVFAIGTQTAAVAVGGSPPTTANGFDYDGTSWTAAPAINTARKGGANGGISTAGIIAGGIAPPEYGNTEIYNGTGWTEVGDLGDPRTQPARGYSNVAGATTSFICATGESPGKTTAVEEWADPVYTIKTVTVS